MIFDNDQLALFYSIISNQLKYVKIYRIRKKTGSRKTREIIAPSDQYKNLQQILLNHFVDNYNLCHETSYAWVKNKNRRDCALMHTDKNCVAEFDIEDYFGNITDNHLLSLFNRLEVSAIDSIPIRDIVMFLTFPKDNRRILPQGFKCSPFFANAVRFDIDNQINDYAKKFKLTYTSYGDNLIFSGDYVPFMLTHLLRHILEQYGFKLKNKKTKFMGRGERQTILGYTVNKKIAVPKEYVGEVIGELIDIIKKEGEITPSLRGKINVISDSANPRNIKYINRLIDTIKRNKNFLRGSQEIPAVKARLCLALIPNT